MNRWLVDAIAVYRLTRLAVEDGITQPVRDRIIEAAYVARGDSERRRSAWKASNGGEFIEGDWQQIAGDDPDPPKLAQLVICPWCASVWIALGLVFVVRRARWWPSMADALAFSAAAGIVTAHVEATG